MSSSARIRTLVSLSLLVTAPAIAQTVSEPEPTFLSAVPGPDRNGGPPPTAAERAALREMEREMDAFGARATAYRETISELGRRELGDRRRIVSSAGSAAAALAADATLRMADENASSFARFAITPGAPATLSAYVETIRAQLAAGAARARTASTSYDRVAAYGHAPSTIAALDAQGTIDERLARGVLDTPFVVPRDLSRTLGRASRDVREAAEADLAARVATSLDEIVRPIECRAIARWVLAARVAREGSLDDAHARHALDRLATYGEDRIGECVAAAHADDASFEAYTPGEITRVPRGLDATASLASPSLAH